MKKVIILPVICFGLIPNMQAQTSIVGHTGTGGEWLGLDGLTPFGLQISHLGNYPINFYTNASSSTSPVNLRMFVEAGGRVGIGNFSAANTLLHLHQSNDFPVDFQMTDNTSGNSTTDGFEMEYHSAGYFNMTQNEFVPFDIRTQGTDGNEYRRIRIWAADTVGRNWTTQHTRVGILSGTAGGYEASNAGTPVAPVSMLTIGDVLGYSNNSSGFRTWMNYGTQVVGDLLPQNRIV